MNSTFSHATCALGAFGSAAIAIARPKVVLGTPGCVALTVRPAPSAKRASPDAP